MSFCLDCSQSRFYVYDTHSWLVFLVTFVKLVMTSCTHRSRLGCIFPSHLLDTYLLWRSAL